MPPKICWAMAVMSLNVEQAKSLAIGANDIRGRPFAPAQAASWTSCSAPSRLVTASAR